MKISFLISCLLLCVSMASSVQAQPYGGYHPYGAQGPAMESQSFNIRRGIRFQKSRDENGYILRIETQGMAPDAIQVTVRGRNLLIQNQESRQVERHSDRGSYQFSTASSSMRRRLSLPPDADVSAMQRSDEEGTVVIRFPYLQGRRY